MKNTIEAEVGYKLVGDLSPGSGVSLYDGNYHILDATIRSYADYVEQRVNGGDETAMNCEVFQTVDGKQFVYWEGNDYMDNYLTEVKL